MKMFVIALLFAISYAQTDDYVDAVGACTTVIDLDGDGNPGNDIYCSAAAGLGLPECDEYSDFDGELAAIQKICDARDDCVGFYDYKDDQAGLRLCSDCCDYTSTNNRVWTVDTSAPNYVESLGRCLSVIELGDGSSNNIYCSNAASFGLDDCGTRENFHDEILAVAAICDARSDCVGFYDLHDDGNGIRLCSACCDYSDTSDRVWRVDTGHSNYVESLGRCSQVLQLGDGSTNNIYCSNAVALGLTPCGTINSIDDEFLYVSNICNARDDCVGIYDYRDDGSGIRMCSECCDYSSTGHRVWSKTENCLSEKAQTGCAQILASTSCYTGLAAMYGNAAATGTVADICPCSCGYTCTGGIDITVDSNLDGIPDLPCSSNADCTAIIAQDCDGDGVADFTDTLVAQAGSDWKCSNNLCIPEDAALDGDDCAANRQCIEDGITCLPFESEQSGERRDLSSVVASFYECGAPRGGGGFCFDNDDCNSDNYCLSFVCTSFLTNADDYLDDAVDWVDGAIDDTVDWINSWTPWSSKSAKSEEQVGAANMAQSVSQMSSNSSTILHIFSFIGVLSSFYFLYHKCFKGKKYEIIQEPEV